MILPQTRGLKGRLVVLWAVGLLWLVLMEGVLPLWVVLRQVKRLEEPMLKVRPPPHGWKGAV